MRDGLFRFYPLFLEKGPPMRKEIPVKEYLSLRPADLKKPEYRHVWLLLFWAIEVPLFFLTEKLPLARHVIYCALDDRIPFCEALILPYVLWFGCCVFVTVYTLLRDVPVYRRFLWYMIGTALVSFSFFLFYPSVFPGQPDPLPRQNFFTWIVSIVYGSDEPTNVFPSEHVITALGMVFATLHSKKLRRPAFSIPFITLQLLICVSVVFVKQHSILDVAGGAAVSLPGYFLFFFPWKKRLPWNDPETAER